LDPIDPILPTGTGLGSPGAPTDEPLSGSEPPPDRESGSSRRSRRRLWVALTVTVVLLASAVIGAAFVRVPYFLVSPGGARATEPLIEVEGTTVYGHEGEVAFPTVSLKESTALQALMGWIDPTVDVLDRDMVLRGRTQDENREANLREMADSKQVATAVALERLGFDVVENGTGAVIVAVVDGTPAADLLQSADVVVAIDDVPVRLKDDLVAAIGSRRPGDRVVLKVESLDGGNPRDVEVELVHQVDDPERPLLGVTLATRDLSYEFPFHVDIDSGRVGGPSAGLSFTLGIMDVLTPSSITGGKRVAATGTMQSDGTVGPVGGVAQKSVAVRRAGIELFLVPRSEYDDAMKYAGDLRVEAVDTLDDALRVLASLGGGDSVLAQAAPSGN
jgi:Lon-like protease